MPPSLFDLTSLQVECNKKFGLTAEQTLNTVQKLYEQKFVTYPRVDTTYLSDDIYPKIEGILQGLTPYSNYTAPLLGKKINAIKLNTRLAIKQGTIYSSAIRTVFMNNLIASSSQARA